ncbi:small GTP-binding protein [Xylanimonas cellulosilytica DSM 15894]|uniref:Small GTP-binding protein n=1 Tax=Xylanimonas cellulosilytica (strain DSM 15894 / JCM 12276 / CECT 5975 / KCTC 9989 / LMG 20990 / NBRC 107835 / XIL07) TaxID=446471 RepID=D1BTT3_XYLCX|nr:elongation factor G [Xylanimonas cellulosilytica]ACZ31062.1 small GTP-binding protein [Xylanimonas cellulosilytica DSM 15894]
MALSAESPANRHLLAALVGGAGSGMTTLVEAVLHRAGVIPRAGTIAAGTTVGDSQPEEVARGTTLTPALTFLEWDDDDGGGHFALTLADTPGHPDFVGGVDAVLSAADLAVVVVSAVAGVTAGTRAAWESADAAGAPRIVMVTCADRPQASFHRVLGELREAFGPHLWPIELPIGTEEDFRAVADVLGRRALVQGPTGRQIVEPLPPEVAAESQSLLDEVTEEIVSHYDALLEAYLEGDEPSFDELQARLAEQIALGDAVPVIVASGVTETGVDRFIDVLCRLVPALTARDATIRTKDGTRIPVARDPGGEPLVHVFDVVADQFVGQIAMLKVLSGTIRPGDRLRNASTGAEERLGNLFRLRGAQRLPCDTLRAGDVGGVAKLVGSPAGSLLWTRPGGHALPPELPHRPAVYSVVLEPVSQADTEKLSVALGRAVAEDHTLEVELSGGHTVVRGLGDTHIDVLVERLARIFGVNVTITPAPVPFRETVAGKARAEGRLKKQSGGHGQFAVVQMVVSPLPPGGGFEFVNSVVGGSVPRQYVPAVEKGVRDALERGGPHGHPVVDVRVELVDGKSHSVDSSDMAFRTAGSLGVHEALAQAGTVVLEPVSSVTVTVPPTYQGAVMTDLAGRRGRVHDTQMTDDGDAVVIAAVPDVELRRYALDLRSLTQGYGRLTITPDHYERAGAPSRA